MGGTSPMNCPECDCQIPIPNDAIQGELVSCKDCGTSYELVREPGSNLFSMRAAELEQEDWGE